MLKWAQAHCPLWFALALVFSMQVYTYSRAQAPGGWSFVQIGSLNTWIRPCTRMYHTWVMRKTHRKFPANCMWLYTAFSTGAFLMMLVVSVNNNYKSTALILLSCYWKLRIWLRRSEGGGRHSYKDAFLGICGHFNVKASVLVLSPSLVRSYYRTLEWEFPPEQVLFCRATTNNKQRKSSTTDVQ